MYEQTDYSVHSPGVWRDELPDGSTLDCPRCLEIHPGHASCTPSPLQDAVSLPPRLKSTITGSLSLHDYRKYLSQECDDPVDRSDKTLKRKPAASNLNRPPPISAHPSCAVSVSSVASSLPPLSPSYSHSIISQRSEQEPDFLDIPGWLPPA